MDKSNKKDSVFRINKLNILLFGLLFALIIDNIYLHYKIKDVEKNIEYQDLSKIESRIDEIENLLKNNNQASSIQILTTKVDNLEKNYDSRIKLLDEQHDLCYQYIQTVSAVSEENTNQTNKNIQTLNDKINRVIDKIYLGR